ncbi:MAG: DNA alkylation repair protein [Prolixibacteraceae bacterium]|jgi:3-methyladenine DNA glycosylase AlkD|nr:DNA alkylation repair protein [Prolixibacteraceae bacterium]
MDKLVQHTIDKLEKIEDQNHKLFMKKMIPSKKTVLGIKTPILKNIIKELMAETANYSLREKIELAIEFIRTDIFEMGQIAYEFIGIDKKLMAALTLPDLERMNYNLDNWASVDTFSVYVFGKAWKTGKVSDAYFMKLVHHPNFWQRRIAIVSTVPLNQKSNKNISDPDRTLKICTEVVSDYEDLVVKALSWALRVLAKREPKAVQAFIDTHQNELHKRVLREVNNTLIFGLKNEKK